MSQETPTPASSSSEQALLEDIGVALDSDNSRNAHARLGDFSAAARAPKIEDPEEQYSADHYGQNAPLAPVPDLIQTGTRIDQEYEINFQVLEIVDKKHHGYILENQKSEDSLEDYTMNEDDQADGKSFDQNISSGLGTDEVEHATLSEKWLQQDFSPTAATPNDISVSKLTTSSCEPLQKSEKVEESKREYQFTYLDPSMGTESVIQTVNGANIVTAHDEAKGDEVNGGKILDKMAEGGTNKFSSTFGVVTDKLALAATGPDTSPTTANDVRLAVPSLEPLLKRAKVNEDVEHTSSSSSAD